MKVSEMDPENRVVQPWSRTSEPITQSDVDNFPGTALASSSAPTSTPASSETSLKVFQIARWLTREKKIALAISTVALVIGILSLYATLEANNIGREANRLAVIANDLATQGNIANWLSYNATYVGLRMSLMQLCADHPDISPKCADIKAWSAPGRYLETGLMVILDPDYRPNATNDYPQNSTNPAPLQHYQSPKIGSSPQDVALLATESVVGGIGVLALLAIV